MTRMFGKVLQDIGILLLGYAIAKFVRGDIIAGTLSIMFTLIFFTLGSIKLYIINNKKK